MSNTDAVLLKIKTVWESNNTFETVDKLVNNTKNRVSELNKSYRDQNKSIGQLKAKITEWRGEQEKSFRTDHIRKYNQLIDGAKKKIEEIENTAKTCGEKTESLFKSVFNANLAVKGLGIAKNAVVGFTKDSVEAYQRHNVARTQLEQVMRNTMGAGKWDTEDIVAVTKAQEKLGIVSSNVQLAGAKELGTYIRKKESLEKLIPTMNNMLAHQYGLNASQENAQSIAQMMGKVLEGQVNALSRNGYSFTEAQEKILKYGNESERVATLMEVIAQSVEGVNAALAATPEGKAKQLAMEYDELKVRVGELTTKLKRDGMVYLYEHRKGIIAIAKVVGSAAVAFATYKAIVASANAVSKINCSVIAKKTLLKKAYTKQVNSATRAMMLFKAVSTPGGIGAIVGVITAAATAFALFRKKSNEASDAMKTAKETYSSFYAQERSQLDAIFAGLKQTNPKSEERKQLVRELSKLYPELNKQTLNDITNTNNLAAAYDILIANIRKKALVKSKESALEVAYKKGEEGEAVIRTLFPDISEKELMRKANFYVNQVETSGGGKYKTKHGEVNIGRVPGGGSRKNLKAIKELIASRDEANKLAKIIGSETLLGTGGGNNNSNNNTTTSTASDAITGGGKQVKNFYINIDSLIKENTNMFQSSSDNPQSAQGFMNNLSEALQRVVNDANYAAT